MQHSEGRLTGGAGASIYYQYWMPQLTPRAVILVVHGAAEHSGRYQHFAEHFTSDGYAVAALDQIGHGQSDGDSAHANRFDDHITTLDNFLGQVQQDFQGLPIVLFGHSMGGLIASNYLLRNQSAFTACILSGPAIKTDLKPPVIQLLLIRFLSLIAPKLGVLQLDASGVSRDPEEVERYRNDPLNYSGKLTARTVAEMFHSMHHIQANASQITLPLLLLHGADDPLTSASGSQFLADTVSSSDKTLKIYPGLYHEIINEPEKDRVFADMDNWLNRFFPREA
jgi:alpha-beta hydrolase superfamily lysophospholipase